MRRWTLLLVAAARALAPPSAWVRRTIAVRELRIEVRERAQMDPDHLGGLTWTGGRALAEYVADRPALVAGKRVLELGCGSALVALTCDALGVQAILLLRLKRPPSFSETFLNSC